MVGDGFGEGEESTFDYLKQWLVENYEPATTTGYYTTDQVLSAAEDIYGNYLAESAVETSEEN